MRLIDADALLQELKKHFNKVDGVKIYHPSMELAMLDVKAAPTIDAVPVVRCGECKWRDTLGCLYVRAKSAKRDDDDYCSDGERREVDGDG